DRVDGTYHDSNDRFTLRSTAKYKPLQKLEIDMGIAYVLTNSSSGFPAWSGIPKGQPLYPYAKLVDQNGDPAAYPTSLRESFIEGAQELGILDWQYRPLEEYTQLVVNSRNLSGATLSTGLRYNMWKNLDFSLQYQYQNEKSGTKDAYGQGSFYVRDYI